MSRRGGELIDAEGVADAIVRAARSSFASGCVGGGPQASSLSCPGQPDDMPAAGLIDAWFAGRTPGRGTGRPDSPEASILSAFVGPRVSPLAASSLLAEGHPVSQAIRRGLDGLRAGFEAMAAEAGAREPERLATRLASLWLGAATTGAWDDHRAAAEALLDADGVGARARREEELQGSEARYRAIFEDSLIRTMIVSPEGQLVQVNRAWERAHGPMAALPPGWSLANDPQLIENGQIPYIRRGLAGEAMKLPAVSYVERKGRPGERERWTQSDIFPIRDQSGAVRELVLMFEDVTEAKQDAKVARGQAEVLARTLDALASGPDLDRFLGSVLEAMADQLRADTAALWFASGPDDAVRLVMEYDAGSLRPASESVHPDASRSYRKPYSPEVAAFLEARRQDSLVFHEDVEASSIGEPYRSYLIAQGIRSVLVLYLFLGPELVGLFSVRSKAKRRYGPEEIALAQALGRQATLAIQLTRLARQARDSAVLEERNRMAREIHDTLAQGLVAILVQLEAGEDARTHQPAEAWRHVARARRAARMGLEEARRSVWALRPGALERHDLPTALARLVGQVADGSPTHARFELVGSPRALRPAVEDELLRIAQEALSNARRHANADRIRVELDFGGPGVRLVVEDDGQGGAPPVPGQGGGFGLIGMRERAERLGARLTIRAAGEGHGARGTRIEVEVPDRDPGGEGGTHG